MAENLKISVRQLVRKWRSTEFVYNVLTVSKTDDISGENWVRGLEEKGEGRRTGGRGSEDQQADHIKTFIPPLEFSDVMCAEGLCLLVLSPSFFPPPSFPSFSLNAAETYT